VETTYLNLIRKIALIIKARRKALGISQEALANIAEIDRSYTSHIERGTANPSLEVICKLAKALDISLAQLLGEAELPPSK
jgi:transcriptional regulator with XRE-family HTH domain